MDAIEERWLPIPGFEGYEVSDQGRVRSWIPRNRLHKPLTQPRILKPYATDSYPYLQVSPHVSGRSVRKNIQDLVLLAFVGPRPAGKVIRHLDGNHLNNALTNLTYGTQSENMRDKRRHGTDYHANKTHCKAGHPYDDANTYRAPGSPNHRHCRACMHAHQLSRRMP